MSLMTVNGLSCEFNLPQMLKQNIKEGKEVAQSLPPYARQEAYKVDEYDCPDGWMHGSSLASSYFVGVAPERGMWLDFNYNSNHTHEVAILISIQGVNPLDGQSMVDGNLSLKQYRNKCPKHDVEFKADRFCEKCGYKWVPQNYLATTKGTGSLWLDGFLAADGVVRQYYFTEKETKGIAHQILGEEKKVYSIGIAYYLSKEPKPVVDLSRFDLLSNLSGVYNMDTYNGYEHPIGSSGSETSWVDNSYHPPEHPTHLYEPEKWTNSVEKQHKHPMIPDSMGKTYKRSMAPSSPLRNALPSMSSSPKITATAKPRAMPVLKKSLDIGAGAKINQTVYADPNELSFWQESPAGLLYINYCTMDQLQEIIAQGKKDLTKGGEGFLADLEVGVE